MFYKTNPTLVISHYDESLEWMNEYDFSNFDVKIYTKGGRQINIKNHQVYHLPNVGRESHTYLKYIIDNYYNLPSVTIFVPASFIKHPQRKMKFDLVMKNYTYAIVKGYYGAIHNCSHNVYNFEMKRYDNGYDFRTTLMIPSVISPYGKWFQTYIHRDISTLYNNGISYNGIFAASLHGIQQNKIEKYIELFKQTQVGRDIEVGHYLERSYPSLFSL